eukprot:scaffold10915_cov65-Phaeocystis_antarctica.AAC.2
MRSLLSAKAPGIGRPKRVTGRALATSWRIPSSKAAGSVQWCSRERESISRPALAPSPCAIAWNSGWLVTGHPARVCHLRLSTSVLVSVSVSGRLEELEEVGAVLLRQAYHQPRVNKGELRHARCAQCTGARRAGARRPWRGLHLSSATAHLLTLSQLAHREWIEPCEGRSALGAARLHAAAAATAATGGLFAVQPRQDVAGVQIGVHKVVLQQHRQEGAQPLPRQRLALRRAETLAAHTITTVAAAVTAIAVAPPRPRAEQPRQGLALCPALDEDAARHQPLLGQRPREVYVRAGGHFLKVVPEGEQVGRLRAKVELPPWGGGLEVVRCVVVRCGVVRWGTGGGGGATRHGV